MTIPSMAGILWLNGYDCSHSFIHTLCIELADEWVCWKDQRGNATNFHYVNWYVLELSDTVLSIKRVACWVVTWDDIIESFSLECYQKKLVLNLSVICKHKMNSF